MNERDPITEMLAMKTIAVVGLSPKPDRASNGVARYLLEHGYRIIPVNPGHEEILGYKSYSSLKNIPEPVEVVDIFRRPEYVLPIVEQAIAIGARGIWMQLGVLNDEAAKMAEEAGLQVVMNRCIKIEHATRHY